MHIIVTFRYICKKKVMELQINNEHLKPLVNGAKPSQEQKEAIMNYILDRFANGEEIFNILKTQQYCGVMTFYNWITNDPKMNALYLNIRAIKAHQLFDDLINTASGKQHEKDSLTAVARDRLITDKMTFYLAKAVPKMYGDKLDVTTNGESINVINLGGGTRPPEPIDITHTEQ